MAAHKTWPTREHVLWLCLILILLWLWKADWFFLFLIWKAISSNLQEATLLQEFVCNFVNDISQFSPILSLLWHMDLKWIDRNRFQCFAHFTLSWRWIWKAWGNINSGSGLSWTSAYTLIQPRLNLWFIHYLSLIMYLNLIFSGLNAIIGISHLETLSPFNRGYIC
jgi:hypothetical protein